eukprot:scaffold231345_cov43-Prasinocladus_malaysianus.AAC.2
MMRRRKGNRPPRSAFHTLLEISHRLGMYLRIWTRKTKLSRKAKQSSQLRDLADPPKRANK